MIADLATVTVLFVVSYKFLTQEERPEPWWSFLPFKTSYISGYDYMRRMLMEGR